MLASSVAEQELAAAAGLYEIESDLSQLKSHSYSSGPVAAKEGR
jgi:hypothetical protein